jgi:imidazolonepropionase-like amidohydrolase
MNNNFDLNVTRRELLKRSAASALLFSIPCLSGCTSVPGLKPTHHSDGRRLILTNCNIIDVVGGRIREERAVVINNGIIESLSSQQQAGADAVTIDMKNGYLIPGLIDAHCHITMTSQSSLDPLIVGAAMRQIKRNFLQQLAAGVTTVRDMGAFPILLHKHLAMIETGELAGPRVVFCNAFTNIKGGHPDIKPSDASILAGFAIAFAGNPNLWFEGSEDLVEKMNANIAGGASFIKLTMDDRSLLCGRNTIPYYGDGHWKIIKDFAQRHRLPLAGHINTRFGFDRALMHGIDSMEHIADARLSDGDIGQMSKKKTAIVPTLTVAQMLAAEEAFPELPAEFRTSYIDGEQKERRQFLNSSAKLYVEPAIYERSIAGLDKYRENACPDLYGKGMFMPKPDLFFRILLHAPANLSRMKEAGILIGCGTDAGVPLAFHGTLWREMEMMVRTGFKASEALQSATINNARILRMDDKIGTIERGKYADIVVLGKNPFQEIEACRTPRAVIRNGRLYDDLTGLSVL